MNYCGPRQDGAVIHDLTFMKLEIGAITEKVAVIVDENLFRHMLIGLSTLKRKSETRVDYQRRCTNAGGSSVPRYWPSFGRKQDVAEYGPLRRFKKSRKDKLLHPDQNGRTSGEFCDELANIEIDN